MKIMWISPNGDGWALAAKLREVGNKVVYFCPDPRNRNGEGYLPRIGVAEWMDYAKKSDTVIVDGNFPSRRTRRSLAPSRWVEELGAIRRGSQSYIGPVPTSELVENDERYRCKVLKRHGLVYKPDAPGVPVTVSVDASGASWLVVREHQLMAGGPVLGNLGDLVVPVHAGSKIVSETVGKLAAFLGKIKYSGFINLALVVNKDAAVVTDVTTRFLYPAIFAQFGNGISQLAGELNLGLAVTLVRFETPAHSPATDPMSVPGFFGACLNRTEQINVTGSFVGAVVGQSPDLSQLTSRVYGTLAGLKSNGWAYRETIGASAPATITQLTEWGWIK